ncbi:MAG: hypothetical protein HYY84_02065 [Deltaproteobacteria bacterium]|nr:hypothetical protein [Deltaproteobacteria bacterium]
MKTLFGGGAVVGLVALSCIINIEPPGPIETIEVPVPVPVPMPSPIPVNAPEIHSLWLFAVTPATATFADEYARWFAGFQAAWARRGFAPKAALGRLYAKPGERSRLFGSWGFTNPSASTISFARAIRTMASTPPAPAAGPEEAALASLGTELGSLRIEVEGANGGVELVANPFMREPSLFVVVTVSSWARRCADDAPECALAGMRPREFFAAEDDAGKASWLSYANGTRLAAARIAHVAVVTREDGDDTALLEGCRAQPNFPALHLDTIESGGARYYTAGRHVVFDYCEVFSDPRRLETWAEERALP